jgi:hypothetical protein
MEIRNNIYGYNYILINAKTNKMSLNANYEYAIKTTHKCSILVLTPITTTLGSYKDRWMDSIF